MRFWTSSLLVVLLANAGLFAGFFEPPPQSDPIDAPEVDPIIAPLVEAHNRIRRERDLPEFFPNAQLHQSARSHAQDMADRKLMTHEGSDGSHVGDRVSETGYRFRVAAENIAAGYRDVDDVLQGWMKSPPHRKNLLGPCTQIGVGRVLGKDDQYYWCVNFAIPSPLVDESKLVREAFRLLNERRRENQSEAIMVDPDLIDVAQWHAQRLARTDDPERLQNQSDAFTDKPFQRLGTKITRYEELGITVALGMLDAQTWVDNQFKTAQSQDQLLNRFNRMGLAVAQADQSKTLYWCLVLGVGRR